MKKTFYFFLAFTVISISASAAVPPGTLIFNSDGQGHGVSVPSNPMSGNLVMRGYGPAAGMTQWPAGYVKSDIVGGIYDGNGNIWLVPGGSITTTTTHVIKVNVTTGQMTGYNGWPAGFISGGMGFRGGVLDDDGYIWMIPCNANMVVRINTVNGQMNGYSSWPSGITLIGNNFIGGTNSGNGYIWLVPCQANMVVRINTSSSNGIIGTMTGYTFTSVNYGSGMTGFTSGSSAFAGGVMDGSGYMWMIPNDADRVVKINTTSANGTIGVMTGYNSWPSGFAKGANAFYGGINSGDGFVWFVPRAADRVIRVNTSNGAMDGYTFTLGNYGSGMVGFTKGGSNAFIGGLFDGQYMWLTPMDADRIVRVNTEIGVTLGQMEGLEFIPANYAQGMTGYTKGTSAFHSGVSDGRSVWLIPYNADRLIRFGQVLVTPPVNTTINNTTALISQAYSGTITANAGYSLPLSVTVTVGGVALAAGSFTYNSSTGAFAISNGADVIGDIVISGPNYTVTPPTNTSINNTSATHNTAYSGTITANTSYNLPTTVTVVVGGSTTLTSGQFSYNNSTGAVTINAAQVTGNIVISGTATLITYTVTPPTNTSINNTSATHSTTYSGTITANTGYNLPTSVTITVGGTTLTSGQFSYNNSTGLVTINAAQVTGNIVISCTTIIPTITISADKNNVCSGTSVTFSPLSTSGDGSSPSYKWFVNSLLVGSGASYTYAPANGDVITCEMTSSEACANPNPVTSTGITMIITPTVAPAVTITATPQ